MSPQNGDIRGGPPHRPPSPLAIPLVSTELAEEIGKFKRLVRSSDTTFDPNAKAFDVLQWLAKSC